MYVCVYIYSNGNVLPSILVPVYVLYIFCYYTLLYGGNKEIYLSISTMMMYGKKVYGRRMAHYQLQ